MGKLRIFISSTCYDFGVLRSELRPFIANMGYEPIMSEYSDILYDPRIHTHTSCVKEVATCHMMILIIGSRFGGYSVPASFSEIDIDLLEAASTKPGILNGVEVLSITQLEALKAVERGIPTYAFIENKVMHDHHVYEKNKNNPSILKQIVFPSISAQETAPYIFEFINYISHRYKNNCVTPFSSLEDIKKHLINQWSMLFQTLLNELQVDCLEKRRYDDFAEKLDDLKVVVMGSIASSNLRETAARAVQFRHLVAFIIALEVSEQKELIMFNGSWEEMLKTAGIIDIVNAKSDIPELNTNVEIFLITEKNDFYMCGFFLPQWIKMIHDWEVFVTLNYDIRRAVYEALMQDSSSKRPILKRSNYPFEDFKRDNMYIPQQILRQCPDCGSVVEVAGDCVVCYACGFSECA